jgi:16S rRNA (cytosine967-C5)-methyltransferase
VSTRSRQGSASREAREEEVRRRARGETVVRERVVTIYAAAARDWSRAPDVVARGLREARELGSAERRFVGEAVHALIRFRLALARAAGDDPGAMLDAWLDGAPTAGSWPEWIAARVDARALEAMDRRAPLTVRANRLRCDREALGARVAKEAGIASRPTTLARDGLILDTRENIYALAAFRDGWMELQDEGSQLVAEIVAPPPGSVVVDACAGAGGKTLALGALLGNRGRVLALDPSARKIEELRRRARRAGLTNVEARVLSDGFVLGAGFADRVLVDAPCTGSGVVRRNPETKWRLAPSDLAELPRKQRAILETYAPLVRPGGRLIYATCSLFAEENDAVIESFLVGQPTWKQVALKEIAGRERALAMGDGERLRLGPHTHDCDGFFAAVLRRVE